jgi:hypothetical protein
MTDIYLQLLSITSQELKWLCSIPEKHFHEVLNSAITWHSKVSFEQGEYRNTKTNWVFKMTINPRWWITSKTLAKPSAFFLSAAWQHTGLAFENPARRNSWHSPIHWLPNHPNSYPWNPTEHYKWCAYFDRKQMYSWASFKLQRSTSLQYKHRWGNFVANVQQHYALKIRTSFLWCLTQAQVISLLRFQDHTRSYTSLPVGLLWRRDLPIAETCT